MFKLRNFVLIAAVAAVALFVGCSDDDDDDSPAPSVVSQIHLVNAGGVGAEIGTVTAVDTSYGLLLEVNVEAATLGAGYHGFHLHTYPSCEAAEVSGTITAGGASGGHYEGGSTAHEGPYGEGHKGDLPQLYATAGGVISNTVVAPRLQLSDIIGRAFIIHAGSDDYGGTPGGARAACGTIGVTETIVTNIYEVDMVGTGVHDRIGTVTATDSPDGLLLVANLTDIPAGPHGFHMHAYPDCTTDGSTPAGNAGGHYIGEGGGPDHEGPNGEGHKGDLPKLNALPGDIVKYAVLAPRLTLDDIRGHAFMIHAGDDDYGANPGGTKIACGVIGE
jgi:Cu-Zn family superoxide dismutase